MSETIVIDYTPNAARLSKAFETSDVIGAVQRGHAEVNDALAHLLDTVLTLTGDGKRIPKEFGRKIGMMRTYCNIPVRIRPLELLNAIRNPIMKDGDESLSATKLDELFDAVNAMYGGRITPRFRDVRSGLQYADMTPPQQFAFLSAAIMFGIAATEVELKAAAQDWASTVRNVEFIEANVACALEGHFVDVRPWDR